MRCSANTRARRAGSRRDGLTAAGQIAVEYGSWEVTAIVFCEGSTRVVS